MRHRYARGAVRGPAGEARSRGNVGYVLSILAEAGETVTIEEVSTVRAEIRSGAAYPGGV
jgi:hypothetical protein